MKEFRSLEEVDRAGPGGRAHRAVHGTLKRLVDAHAECGQEYVPEDDGHAPPRRVQSSASVGADCVRMSLDNTGPTYDQSRQEDGKRPTDGGKRRQSEAICCGIGSLGARSIRLGVLAHAHVVFPDWRQRPALFRAQPDGRNGVSSAGRGRFWQLSFCGLGAGVDLRAKGQVWTGVEEIHGLLVSRTGRGRIRVLQRSSTVVASPGARRARRLSC